MRLMILLAIAAVSGRACAAELPSPPKPGTYTLEITSSGHNRTAHVHIPTGYEAGKKLPMVLAFHGAGGQGEMMLSRYGWADKADDRGFIVVAATGLPAIARWKPNFLTNPHLWNSGQLRSRSPRAKIDDVKYVAELLDELKLRLPYDEDRVFATGHSNGAGMTFRLGAELSERFAAIAAVSGMLAVEEPKPTKALPTLYIIGTKDPLQPIEGGKVKLPWGTRTNVPVSNYLTTWANGIGCELEPRTVFEKEGVKKVEYPSKSGSASLTVIYIEGHGHEWPGGDSRLPERLIGPKTNKLVATDVIWEFFADTVTD